MCGLVLTLGSVRPAYAQHQTLQWNEEGDTTVPVFGANATISIAQGTMDYVSDCPGGVEDEIWPWTDVYIVPAGSFSHTGPAKELIDLSGEKNAVLGTSDGGLFMGEPIGNVQPGGKVGVGKYAVVYDECQDGEFTPGVDALFDPAFRVSDIPADVPPLPSIAAAKEQARVRQEQWQDMHLTYQLIFGLQDGVKVLGKVWECGWGNLALKPLTNASPVYLDCNKVVKTDSNYFTNMKLTEGFFKGLTLGVSWATGVDAKKMALNHILNTSGHYGAIANDPPDPDFRKVTPLESRPVIDPETGDRLDIAAARLGTAAGNEDRLAKALLHSLERYQGADAADNGDWALIHARAVRDYSKRLAEQLEATDAALAGVSTALSEDTRPFLSASLVMERYRSRIASSGFTAEELQEAANLGLTDAQVAKLKADILATDLSGYDDAQVLAQHQAIRDTNASFAADLEALAAQMAPIITQLEAEALVWDGAPVADAGGPYAGDEGTAIAFSGSATGESVAAKYEWDLDGDGAFDDATGATPSRTFDRPFRGFVGVRVTNTQGEANVAYSPITVNEANRPPQVTELYPAEGTLLVEEGTKQPFGVTATDPDGDPVSLQWYVGDQPVSQADIAEYAPTDTEPTSRGVRVEISDGHRHGGTVTLDWLTHTVRPDADKDGWRVNRDCDDTNPAVNPGATEIVGNGKDDDCDPNTSDKGQAAMVAFNPEPALANGIKGLNVALKDAGAKLLASSSHLASGNGGYTAAGMLDYEDFQTRWLTASGQFTNQWAKFQLMGDQPYLVDRIGLRPGYIANDANAVREFEVAVSATSPDGPFETVLRATAANTGKLQEFVFTKPVLARYVLYKPLKNNGGTSYIETNTLKVYSGQEGGRTVTFRDLSVDPENDAASYRWDFGDGQTSEEQHPAHIFPEGSKTYPVKLTVTDAQGNAATHEMTYRVLTSPSANFTYAPWGETIAKEGHTITFTPTSGDTDGAILTAREWAWGGEVFGRELYVPVDHRFPDNGSYAVKFLVMDDQEQVTEVQKTVLIENVAPGVTLDASQTLVWGRNLNLGAVRVGDAGPTDAASLVCDWDFGDGETTRVENCSTLNVSVRHAYAKPGAYTANLKVTDKDGASTSKSMAVTVTKHESLLTITAGRDASQAGPIEVAAKLTDLSIPGTSMAGKTVTLSLGEQSADATVGADGVARAMLNSTGDGKLSPVARYTGNEFYAKSMHRRFENGDVFAGTDGGKIRQYTVDGTLIALLDASPDGDQTGMCFDDDGNLYSTNFGDRTMTKFNRWGDILKKPWATMFSHWPETCVVDATGNVYTGEVDGEELIRKFDPQGNLLDTFKVSTSLRGVDWMDLAADQCTMLYTSELKEVFRYNVCTKTQLSPLTTSLTGQCFALRIRPNGEVLVACDDRVYRLDTAGKVIQTYQGGGLDTVRLFALNLDRDGTSFWTGGIRSGKIWKIDIETGEVLTSWQVPTNRLPGIAVFGENTAAQNQAPTADAGPDREVATGADVALDGSGSSDPDAGDTLTYAWKQTAGPAVSLSGAEAVRAAFTPAAAGSYSFELEVSDGQASDTDSVTITVEAPANSAPVANDAEVSTGEDEPATVTLSATDADGDALTYVVVMQPQHGALSGTAPALTYTPDANYVGADSFTYKASDGTQDSNVATVSVAVQQVNDGPDAKDDEATTDEDKPLTLVQDDLLANDSDPDTAATELKIAAVSGATHGAVELLSSGEVQFTPEADYSGPAGFNYTLSDGALTDAGHVAVTVTPVNDAPQAQDDDVATDEDRPVDVDILANDADIDGDTLSVILVGEAGHGEVAVVEGKVRYAPEPNYHGTDSFTYKLSDWHGGAETATVRITVEPVNDVPEVEAGEDFSTEEGSNVDVSFDFTDVEDDQGHTCAVSWGDGATTEGSVTEPVNGEPGRCDASHTYADDDPTGTPSDAHEVTVKVSDTGTPAESGVARLTAKVSNAAPAVVGVTGPVDPVKLGAAGVVSTSYTDASTKDSHECSLSWGDGTPDAKVAGVAGKCVATHTFTAPGVYPVVVDLTDDDTGSVTARYEYVVVYDSAGGFVTGGGWIDSPVGAYKPDASLTGRANFGFVSKYKTGTTVPTGSTEFQFRAAGMNFHSSSYDWLVVSGAKAQYKGTGKINGEGTHGFMLTAIDGQITGGGGTDRFRIKIWEKATGEVVYDNQIGAEDGADPTTALKGGSVTVHKGK